jgi:hypothetical protein
MLLQTQRKQEPKYMPKKKKENRGGARAGTGPKKKYICDVKKFQVSAPEHAVNAIKAFAKKASEKYLAKK